MTPTDESAATEKIDSKVARLIEQYQLGTEFGEQLEERWTAEAGQRDSLRSLADRFNKRLLEATMTDAGLSTVDGEAANIYRLLTDDEVSSGDRTEARGRLEKHGIDLDELETDFVSYQAIRSYLTAYRGAEYTRDRDSTRIDSVIETIQRLQSRMRSVAERSLTQLQKTDRISVGEFRLFIELTVLCEECNTQYGIVDLLKRGGCDCESA